MIKKQTLIASVISASAGLFAGLVLAVGWHAQTSERLRVDYAECAPEYVELTSQYCRHFDQNGGWPVPGTYSTTYLQYISTGTHPSTGHRRDVYQSSFDGDMRVEVELRADGTIRVRHYPV